jgi:DNA-directed RNA polymerase subunit RPC12/RpoP
MTSSAQFKFECPDCAAQYELVRVEAPPEPSADREITCLSCGGPLRGHQGPFVLKYFLVERPKQRASRR